MKPDTYIVETDSLERESEAIRRLLSSFHKENVLGPMGLGTLSWVIMEAQMPTLVPGLIGDADILAGTLAFRDPERFNVAFADVNAQYIGAHPNFAENLAGRIVAEDGGIEWPPKPSDVVGVEVKCSYFDRKPRSTKSSPDKVSSIRQQIDKLLKMGLDRVALLDVIANPPSDGVDSGAWLAAASQAQTSLEAAKEFLDARLAADSPSAQFVWAVGPVVGGTEGMRGAGVPHLLRKPQLNPAVLEPDPKTVANRSSLMASIGDLLGAMPKPRCFPVIYLDCRKCLRLHLLDDHCS